MKKVGDLFEELGFSANGSDDVKIAFIKNLVRSAYGVELQGPKKRLETKALDTKKLEQLSFDLDPTLKKAN